MAGCCGPVASTNRAKEFIMAPNGEVHIGVPSLGEPVRFFVVGDTHFGLHDERDDAYRDNYARLSKKSAKKAEFEGMLKRAHDENVDLVCLVGDTISFPSLANVEYVERALKTSGVKWVYIAGNHDWHFEGVPGSDAEQRAEWTSKRLLPLHQGRNPLFSSIVVKGVRFVMIDNSIYHVGEEQLVFWKSEAQKGDPTVLLMHIPLWSCK